MMGLYIPFAAFSHDDENAHIVSKVVWVAVAKFASQTVSLAEGSTPVNKAHWEEYSEVLKNNTLGFQVRLEELMQEADGLQRPFHSQAVALIQRWEALADHEGVKGETRASALKELKQ